MRVRLLIDINVSEDTIPEIGELISDQPPVDCVVRGGTQQRWTGRLMGAQPVHHEEDEGNDA